MGLLEDALGALKLAVIVANVGLVLEAVVVLLAHRGAIVGEIRLRTRGNAHLALL